MSKIYAVSVKKAEPECYEGVPGTIQKMMLIKQNDKLPDIIEGFIVTMYRNTLTNRKVTEALKESYGDLVFTSYIPRLEEAVKASTTTLSNVSDSKSRIGSAYFEIAAQIGNKEE